MVSGYEAVELIVALIPLNGVQSLAVQVEVALQSGALIPDGVAGYPKFYQF